MAALPLLLQVFSLLTNLVEERAGLHYRPEDLDLVRDKISLRAESLGFESMLDYYYFLRYDPGGSAELDTLVEALTVHETYFFRELDQLKGLVDILLPRILATGRTARIWCAACATGEEPLTLAMMLEARGMLDKVRILASDVSERALAKARGGRFAGRALRALPEEAIGRWLLPRENGVAVRGDLLEAIEWRRINLLNRAEITALGRFDVILCRNVLIYFSDSTTRAVVGTLSDALEPGGHLLVGAAESLLRYGTSLSCDEHGRAFYYRKVS